jgi:nitrogen fixation/metabolism regulation signal transduction histidine kinase
VSLWNNAARRLFASHTINRLEDLKVFGPDLSARISSIQPGDRILVGMDADNMRQTLTLSASEILTSGQTERLISLQNIQNELDGMQLQAWQDLVRVLTHEIMNSVTPVSSLAKTASVLVQDVREKIEPGSELVDELNDIKDAVDTVARRSDGLMGFVESYQRLMRLPEPDRSRFRIAELFADVARIATVDWLSLDIALEQHTDPAQLDVHADRQMLEQVLINLLKNAEQALANQAGGRVILSAALNPRGQVTIEVADNGPGIPDEIAARMFVPFYTTRSDGSGVGLALSRQVMNAHGGTISYIEGGNAFLAQSTGARFTLAF